MLPLLKKFDANDLVVVIVVVFGGKVVFLSTQNKKKIFFGFKRDIFLLYISLITLNLKQKEQMKQLVKYLPFLHALQVAAQLILK